MRDMNPANDENWRLICKICRTEFHDNAEMGMVAEHWKAEHEADHGETPEVELEWIGIGPAPKGRPPR